MPHVPPELKERLKREVSVQRLAEARGVKLKRSGKELIGLCPFHKDSKPSLRIDSVANKWHCFGCDRKGDVIEWVRHAEGVSFNHAIELLKRDYFPLAASAGPPPKHGTVRRLQPPIERNADDRALLQQVVSYYTKTLKESPAALKYLEARGLKSSEMIDRFRLGFANRTIGYYLPDKNRAAGAELRERLQKVGIYRESGHEHFSGSVVIPVLSPEGEVMQMYGRKITRALREGTPEHLYLSGPRRGVWNEEALIASKEIILCEALIDALTFWCAGFRHVTTSYGVNGFTEDIKAAFKKYGTRKIYIAYDHDDAGDKAAQAHGEELLSLGLECFRVQFPRGQDANEFAQKNQPAVKFLTMYLNRAEWLGKGQRPTVAVIEPTPTPEPEQIENEEEKPAAKEKNISSEPGPDVPEEIPTVPATPAREETSLPAAPEIRAERILLEVAEPVLSFAAKTEETGAAEEPPRSAPLPSVLATTVDVPTEVKDGEVIIWQGERRYRVRGLQKNMSYEQLRVNVMVSGANLRGQSGFHVDTLDLYSARPRTVFIKQAAAELGVKEETIHGELGRVLRKLEELQHEQIKQELEPKEKPVLMTEEEQAEAMKLLGDPRLLDRVLEDFDKCGVVGEETNKRVSYLAAVSRLLPKPLAIVVQSSSSAGKSSLMEAVLDFMPEEQRESYTAMTSQALFYMGEKNLKHKILAIAEQQGAERAAYPLKLLQSEGKLTIASTGKDPVSGKHVTHDYTVEGPVMIFLTTTATDVDEELMNRCIVLTVNEDREQTRAIHQKQREAQTLEGLKARMRHRKILRLHRNAQRLLRPVQVVIEHLKDHSFPDTMTRTRRDHMKFLTLIQAIALLHQHQREIKTSAEDGETLEYIEATEDDVKLAWELTNQALVRSLDDVPPQTRRLLLLIDKMVTRECARLEVERLDYRFTRATVRQSTGWGDSQLKKHLSRLEDLEYLALHRGAPGQSFVYALNFEMDEQGKPVLPGLSYGAKRSRFPEGVSHLEAGMSRPGHGLVTGVSRSGHDEESPATAQAGSGFSEQGGKNISRGAEAHGPQNRVVAEGQPNGASKTNGHALIKRAGVR
jgi:DNA primase catalytic core